MTRGDSELVCLLPARNCADDLAGWLESVERFADAVVALDDGSTDGTRAVLEGHPLVKRLLVNPRRETYAGWDDAGNRARLLAAASDLRPRWILSLDADERIPPDDGAALTHFLRAEAKSGCAYFMRVHRMIGDLEHFDLDGLWVGRLFGFEPEQEFPTDRLHFNPIPVSIPRARWRNTTIRIQHLSGLTAQHRLARYDKYREADPDRRYQASYDALLKEPESVRRWRPRPPCLPVLANGRWTGEPDRAEEDMPALSAIVVGGPDAPTVTTTVSSVVRQELPEPFEVIVATGTEPVAGAVLADFPSAQLVMLPRSDRPGEEWAAGLARARGRYVVFVTADAAVPDGSLAARLRAHRLGYAMITGSPVNGTPTPSGWAAYFLDHSGILPGQPSEILDEPPAECSYLRVAIEAAGEALREGGTTVLNRELFRLGYGAYRAHDVGLVHTTPCTTPGGLATQCFVHGRAAARGLIRERRPGQPLLTRRMLRDWLVRYVPRRWLTIRQHVRQCGDADLGRRWRRAAGLVLLGITLTWLGAWYELLRPARAEGAVAPIPSARRRPAR